MTALAKPPAASHVEMTQIVLPGDANALGTAFGGKIMQWIDVCAAVAARRHTGGVVVTASMDMLQFVAPVRQGDVVVLRGSVNRAWNSSMEVGVRVEGERAADNTRIHAATAYLTFVALDPAGNKRAVPSIQPQSEAERRRYDEAGLRREARLAQRKRRSCPI
jgi:acyl-CoA hydrolase